MCFQSGPRLTVGSADGGALSSGHDSGDSREGVRPCDRRREGDWLGDGGDGLRRVDRASGDGVGLASVCGGWVTAASALARAVGKGGIQTVQRESRSSWNQNKHSEARRRWGSMAHCTRNVLTLQW